LIFDSLGIQWDFAKIQIGIQIPNEYLVKLNIAHIIFMLFLCYLNINNEE